MLSGLFYSTIRVQSGPSLEARAVCVRIAGKETSLRLQLSLHLLSAAANARLKTRLPFSAVAAFSWWYTLSLSSSY